MTFYPESGTNIEMLIKDRKISHWKKYVYRSYANYIMSYKKQKQPTEVFYGKVVLQSFCSIHRKIPVSESLFNKAACLQALLRNLQEHLF